MEIVIKERIARRMRSDLAEVQIFFAHAKKGWNTRGNKEGEVDDDVVLDLSKLTVNEVERLHKALATSKILGTKVLAADVQKYLRAGIDGIEGMTARTVRQAAWLIEHTIASLPHHLLFSPDEYGGGSYVGYFVNDVDFTEEKHGRDGYEPPECDFTLVWIENDVRMSRTVTLKTEDIVGLGPEEILRRKGLVLETSTLMDRLRDETERYYQMREQIGKRHVARGIGLVDLDDAAEGKRSRVYRGHGDTIQLDLFGMPTPVVIDVLGETGEVEERRERQPSVNVYRWHSWNLRFFSPSEDDLVRHLEADENTEFEPATQVPVHPLVPCFDLRRHARLRVHLNNLTPYMFRREVGDRLILPPRDRALIEMLVDESENTFQDVVSGKGQSVNILSGGQPGTGKTLTAEVLAEYKERPLYSVQCSQLGIDPETIEKNLAVVLQRANRWNAILLLDEADVYITKRGSSLQHNAIVGVFLRILEYAQCILIMTTNLAANVDDAIASRCIVKIGYEVPPPDDQIRIWEQLAELNTINISHDTIHAFVAQHPKLSGRDVKNLLKLASFVAKRTGRAVDLGALEFALQYKPTAS
jgi:hypothetical protein